MTAPLIPGAEPWSAVGGSNGVLVLHGFTGNPQSMRPLAEALAAAGLTVELPLLPGHGTALEDMAPTRWDDWSGAAEAQFQALAARCDHVAVVGLSMGGTLTCWLAERHPHLSGIALVNPLVHAPDAEFRSGIQALLDVGTETFDGIGSDIKKAGSVEANCTKSSGGAVSRISPASGSSTLATKAMNAGSRQYRISRHSSFFDRSQPASGWMALRWRPASCKLP